MKRNEIPFDKASFRDSFFFLFVFQHFTVCNGISCYRGTDRRQKQHIWIDRMEFSEAQHRFIDYPHQYAFMKRIYGTAGYVKQRRSARWPQAALPVSLVRLAVAARHIYVLASREHSGFKMNHCAMFWSVFVGRRHEFWLFFNNLSANDPMTEYSAL